MTLYAVCYTETLEEDKLITFVEAATEDEALIHHFRKYIRLDSVGLRDSVLDLSSDGFLNQYFAENEAYSDYLSEKLTKAFDEYLKKMLTIPEGEWITSQDPRLLKIESEFPQEAVYDAAEFLIEHDLVKNRYSDYLILEVEIEKT